MALVSLRGRPSLLPNSWLLKSLGPVTNFFPNYMDLSRNVQVNTLALPDPVSLSSTWLCKYSKLPGLKPNTDSSVQGWWPRHLPSSCSYVDAITLWLCWHYPQPLSSGIHFFPPWDLKQKYHCHLLWCGWLNCTPPWRENKAKWKGYKDRG